MYCKILLFILFVLSPIKLISSDTFSEIGLMDLYDSVISNNLLIQSNELEIQVRNERIKQSQSELLPNISLNAEYNYNDNIDTKITENRLANTNTNSDLTNSTNSVSSFSNRTNSTSRVNNGSTTSTRSRVSGSNQTHSQSNTNEINNINISTNTNTFIRTNNNNDRISLQMEWSIWDQEKRNEKIARVNDKDVFLISKDLDRQEVITLLSTLYFRVLHFKNVIKIHNEELDHLNEIMSLASRQVQQGFATESSLADIEVEKYEIEASIEDIKLSLFETLTQLNNLSGRRLSGYSSFKELQTKEVANASLDEYVKNQYSSYELELAKKQVDASWHKIELAKSMRKPKVNLSVQYNFTNEQRKSRVSTQSNNNVTETSTIKTVGSGTISEKSTGDFSNSSQSGGVASNNNGSTKTNSTGSQTTRSTSNIVENINSSTDLHERSTSSTDEKYRIFLTLSIPLYSGGRINSAIREEALEYKKSLLNMDYINREYKNRIASLFNNHDAFQKRISIYEKAIDKQMKSNKEYLNSFAAGYISKIDLLNNQSDLFDLKLKLLESQRLYIDNIITFIFSVQTKIENNIRFLSAYLN